MRIVTFNIHHGTVGPDGPVDGRRLGAICAAFEADVLTLQEVDRRTYRAHRQDLTAMVAEACGMAAVFGRARWFPGGQYGNAVLVRGSISSWSVARLPRVPAKRRWQEPRALLTARCRIDGVDLTVATMHLATEQPVSAVQLDAALDLVNRQPGPVVVTGDLNRFRPTVEPSATAAGLTYVAHGPTNPLPGPPHRIIDHCLLSPGLVLRHAEVHPTEMSDHAALIIDVDHRLGPALGHDPGDDLD